VDFTHFIFAQAADFYQKQVSIIEHVVWNKSSLLLNDILQNAQI
jgi:hypothetical protein